MFDYLRRIRLLYPRIRRLSFFSHRSTNPRSLRTPPSAVGARASWMGSQALAEGAIPFLRWLRAPGKTRQGSSTSFSLILCSLSLTGTVFQRARVHVNCRSASSSALSLIISFFAELAAAMNRPWFWQARKICRVLFFSSLRLLKLCLCLCVSQFRLGYRHRLGRTSLPQALSKRHGALKTKAN
jgi:hypothetical protein